jgi:hypothetical protein
MKPYWRQHQDALPWVWLHVIPRRVIASALFDVCCLLGSFSAIGKTHGCDDVMVSGPPNLIGQADTTIPRVRTEHSDTAIQNGQSSLYLRRCANRHLTRGSDTGLIEWRAGDILAFPGGEDPRGRRT